MTRSLRIALALAIIAGLSAAPAASSEASAGWYVVTFDGRISQLDHDALAAAGGEGIQYVPHDAYLAYLEAGEVADASALGELRAVDASEKVDPGATGPFLDVVVFGPAIGGVLAAAGDVVRAVPVQPDGDLHQVVLPGDARLAERLAALPAVLWVGPASARLVPEDEASDQIVAGNYTGNTPAVGYGAWLAAKGIDGSGVRVSIVDTGVDTRHPDLAGRVVASVDYSRGEPFDVGGHGTHVAGIVGGNASALAAAGGVKDAAGFLYGLGVAPKVDFVSQNAIATTYYNGWPPSYGWDRLSRDAVRNGASIWNASWHSGEGTNAGYINSARTMDIMARDADWLTGGAEPITMVFSAGNGGGTSNTITSPKEAKNLITVGNSLSHRAGSINAISSSSSKGPARDGRILPTVAAPGSSIASARSLPAAQSCNTPMTDSYGFYALCSGTSMASPHVAGAVALITQRWRQDHGGADPSPAMSKALLVNTATDMGTKDIPNRNEGWGRVNLGNLFDGTPRLTTDQSVVLTDPGTAHEVQVRAADPSQPLKVTLVWSDAPGAPGAIPALVNDLDLTVAAGGSTWYGNRFSAGASIPGALVDRLNNVENVFLTAPGSDVYTVRVGAFNLPGDGVPFAGDETDQDFALVISNAIAAE